MIEFPWLTLTIWLPILGGVAVIVSGDKTAELTKWLALIVAVLTFLVSLPLWLNFNPHGGIQFIERTPWIPSFNVYYYLGVGILSRR